MRKKRKKIKHVYFSFFSWGHFKIDKINFKKETTKINWEVKCHYYFQLGDTM